MNGMTRILNYSEIYESARPGRTATLNMLRALHQFYTADTDGIQTLRDGVFLPLKFTDLVDEMIERGEISPDAVDEFLVEIRDDVVIPPVVPVRKRKPSEKKKEEVKRKNRTSSNDSCGGGGSYKSGC